MTHLGKADWTDPERVRRMAESYRQRYDSDFWESLEHLIGTSEREVVADFGCGPGLLLSDLARNLSSSLALGVDESSEMLEYAESALAGVDSLRSYSLKQANFDSEEIPLDSDSVDLGFCGFMLHEVASPSRFLEDAFRVVRKGGSYVVYDYVSGDRDAFIRAMSSGGMSPERAAKRYPHMCKHSIEDIEGLLSSSEFQDVQSIVIDGIRAVVAGLKY